jgi:hypothetical protein
LLYFFNLPFLLPVYIPSFFSEVNVSNRKTTILALVAVVLVPVAFVLLIKTQQSNTSAPGDLTANIHPADSIGQAYEESPWGKQVESDAPPEFEPVHWAMESLGPMSKNTKSWSDAERPDKSQLPDSITWDYFHPDRKRGFSQQELDRLCSNGFFLEEISGGEYVALDDMVDDYQSLRVVDFGDDYSTVPVFISADFLLHLYHVVFDRALQQAEERKLYFLALKLTKNLCRQSIDDYSRSKGATKQAMLTNVIFFSVAGRLLDSTFVVDPAAREVVDKELALIVRANQPSLSAFTHREEDYTQFKPRGHYTRSQRLAQYFRAMMWFGRTSFPVDSVHWTMAAMWQAQACTSTGNMRGESTGSQWKQLARIYSYLVGPSDDLNCEDYAEAMKKVYSVQHASIEDFRDSLKMTRFVREARILSSSRVAKQPSVGVVQRDGEQLCFRLFGQAFTPEALIFTKLTSPTIGTEESPRNIPSALDVMAVLGSPAAEELSTPGRSIRGYESTVKGLRIQFAAYPDNTWTQSVYCSWLYTLQSLFNEKGTSVPPFMQTPAWKRKVLLTALGSWTELKHDTILLSKQSGAECGEGEEGPPPPPQPKSYVEPDLQFFDRLFGLIQTTARIFSENMILSDEYLRKFSLLLDRVVRLRKIAQKELLNAPISKDEYKVMIDFASDVGSIVIPEGSGDIIDDKFKQMALVTDVHTDLIGGMVLEEGVGSPQRIYVAVSDSSGGTRVCVGYVYTYYEFTKPMAHRMTDEEWKSLIYPKPKPEVRSWEPEWIASLRVN